MKKPGRKFWTALILFGLTGQVAWTVENMYLNVFIYKMFHASASDISLMVGASAAVAAFTTIFMGALSDRLGKRKVFICGGYMIWGIAIAGFGMVRMDLLTPFCASVAESAAFGVVLVILLDCVMTFLGSTANDAAYNAWITDAGDGSNRGKIEGINAMMPLLSILLVFGGFMGFDLEQADSWSMIFAIVGGVVLILGVSGIFLIEEVNNEESLKARSGSYWHNLTYSFRISTIRDNPLLYTVIGAFALFGISIQIFMPYLILYYEQTLQMENYVLIMAPAIVMAAVVTVIYGRFYDKLGFQKSIVPCMLLLVGGYAALYFSVRTVPVFLGSLLMMCGYLCGMAVFGAKIREQIPQQMAGRFQGIRIIGQVLIPGVIGPAVGAFVLKNAAQIENSDGTFSFLPNRNIWAAATLAAILVGIALACIFRMIRLGHNQLLTDAGERLQGKQGWDIYPRPQMKRKEYVLLNQGWSLNGHSIRIPFPPQAFLADYPYSVGSRLTYETVFQIPEDFAKEKILLHFGAVDQIAEIWINDRFVGKHEDGYLSFTFDVTEKVNRGKENRLVVKVTDTLDKKYPYGKQSKKRGGMWYTPVSGIWKDVWLENVPSEYIRDIRLKPDMEGVDLHLDLEISREFNGFSAAVTLENGEILEKRFEKPDGRIQLSDYICADGKPYKPVLWTPENPFLYSMVIRTQEDLIETYFALRSVEIREMDGTSKVCLNGRPVFLHGVLDQGYYCDGLYLPPEPEEYERDILRMKELGFNLLRKHIKIEPEIFYYYCDKHGMLVMQDMVNSGKYSFLFDTALPTIGVKKRKDQGRGKKQQKQIFMKHMKQAVRQLYNHPCVVAYTIFNEGWGQFDSDRMYDELKSLDDTRLVDSTSGWFHQEKSDFDSEHIYFELRKPQLGKRPLLVSECGGYSRVIEKHYYSKYNTYGYGGAKDQIELTDRIEEMYRYMILPGIREGICGCIYTQLSDVEDEINGLYTYDRKICKVDKERMHRLAEEIRKLADECPEKV